MMLFWALFALFVGFPLYWTWTSRVTVSIASFEEAVEDLIRDVERTTYLFVVICSRCLLGNATDEMRDQLLDLLKRKHAAGIDFHLWTLPGEVHPDLLVLSQGKSPVIKIHWLPSPFPFSGRIVDSRIIHRYLNRNQDVVGAGVYARANNARQEAVEVLESLPTGI